MTVLIVDDHTLARKGLRAMLEAAQWVQVVGEAADGLEALDLVGKLHPKVVLMDVRMPVMDGLTATRLIKAAHPTTAVILITHYDDDAVVVDGVLAGVAGHLLKDASQDLLLDALTAVADGGTLIEAGLLRRAIDSLAALQPMAAPAPSTPERVDELTPRELQVLKLLADGQTNKEIAGSLSLAEVTVKKHIQCIVAKLGASDRTQAATTALRTGLIS